MTIPGEQTNEAFQGQMIYGKTVSGWKLLKVVRFTSTRIRCIDLKTKRMYLLNHGSFRHAYDIYLSENQLIILKNIGLDYSVDTDLQAMFAMSSFRSSELNSLAEKLGWFWKKKLLTMRGQSPHR